MGWFKNIIENIKGTEDFSDIKSSTVRDILNGNILTKRFIQKQYGVMIMLSILVFMYIDNRYYCETQLSKEIELKKEIQDLKYQSLTISSELMGITMESNIEKMVQQKGLDLEVPATPPIVIEK